VMISPGITRKGFSAFAVFILLSFRKHLCTCTG
jgi:hypothetical protein